MGDEELDAYSKKKIKLKEIQKALASKEKQSSIINLCIFSFVVFILVILSSVASILMNGYFYDQISIYYNLIEKSTPDKTEIAQKNEAKVNEKNNILFI